MTPFSRLRGPGRVLQDKLPQERAIWQGEIQPAPFVSRTRNKSGKVVIDDDSITLTNSSGRVTIDSTSITVESGDGTVIIDGSSNMFKIIASGTISLATNNGDDLVTNETILTGLGNMSTTPAHLSFVSINNTSTTRRQIGTAISDASDFVATTSGGSPTAARVMGTSIGCMRTYVNGSNKGVVELRVTNAAAGSATFYGYYHVLQEAAL